MLITPMTESEILLNIQTVADTIEQINNIARNDGDALQDYLACVTSIQALATETHASVRYILLKEREEVLNKMLKSEIEGIKRDGSTVTLRIPPSTAKMFAESRTKDWEYVYAKTERLCRNISHSIDSARTLLSFIKAERFNTGN
jgi:hypothetical protein